MKIDGLVTIHFKSKKTRCYSDLRIEKNVSESGIYQEDKLFLYNTEEL